MCAGCRVDRTLQRLAGVVLVTTHDPIKAVAVSAGIAQAIESVALPDRGLVAAMEARHAAEDEAIRQATNPE